uniref:Uncharacterized protein n=1 Tax=Arundo donax TaxID=35708 RepID=A0A0A9FM18_ARUDO
MFSALPLATEGRDNIKHLQG